MSKPKLKISDFSGGVKIPEEDVYRLSESTIESLVVSDPLAKKIMQVKFRPGAILEMRVDNRYKDGNVQIVNNVVRGNKNTVGIGGKII